MTFKWSKDIHKMPLYNMLAGVTQHKLVLRYKVLYICFIPKYAYE